MDELDRVISAVFYNIQKIKEQGVRDDLVEEIKVLSKLKFDFKEKDDPISEASDLAARMKKFSDNNIEDILWSTIEIKEVNKDRINEVIGWLKHDNLNVYVSSPKFKDQTDKREPWM